MPFRNKATLETWLAEFLDMGYPVAGTIKILDQDGERGADTGLVSVHLRNASTAVYMQPETPAGHRWVVTLEPRDTSIELDAVGLLQLAEELHVVSALCAFLQSKSRSFTVSDGR